MFKVENLKDEEAEKQVWQKIAIAFKKQFNIVLGDSSHYLWP